MSPLFLLAFVVGTAFAQLRISTVVKMLATNDALEKAIPTPTQLPACFKRYATRKGMEASRTYAAIDLKLKEKITIPEGDYTDKWVEIMDELCKERVIIEDTAVPYCQDRLDDSVNELRERLSNEEYLKIAALLTKSLDETKTASSGIENTTLQELSTMKKDVKDKECAELAINYFKERMVNHLHLRHNIIKSIDSIKQRLTRNKATEEDIVNLEVAMDIYKGVIDSNCDNAMYVVKAKEKMNKCNE